MTATLHGISLEKKMPLQSNGRLDYSKIELVLNFYE